MSDPSTAIAKLIEAGWTLSADVCPSCTSPLLTGGKLCVQCKGVVQDKPKVPELTEEPIPERDVAWTEAQAIMDRQSASMADKLLAGWAMLDAQCPYPTCVSPLLRDPKTKERVCIDCGRTFPAEGPLLVEPPKPSKPVEIALPAVHSHVSSQLSAALVLIEHLYAAHTTQTMKMNDAAKQLLACEARVVGVMSLLILLQSLDDAIKIVEFIAQTAKVVRDVRDLGL